MLASLRKVIEMKRTLKILVVLNVVVISLYAGFYMFSMFSRKAPMSDEYHGENLFFTPKVVQRLDETGTIPKEDYRRLCDLDVAYAKGQHPTMDELRWVLHLLHSEPNFNDAGLKAYKVDPNDPKQKAKSALLRRVMAFDVLAQAVREHKCTKEQQDLLFDEARAVLENPSSEPEEKGMPVKVLGHLGDDRSLALLLPLTEDSHEQLRHLAQYYVNRLQSKNAEGASHTN